MKIETFEFNINGINQISKNIKGKNWPVVYMLHNKTDLYIGETTSAKNRIEQHLNNPDKKYLKEVNIVFDDLYNKSVVLDFEQKLIKYFKSDGKFENILNKNTGQSALHEYYNRDNYYDEFKKLWNKLVSLNLANHKVDLLENLNIFKFSPYTYLTEEQNEVSYQIINDIYKKLTNKETGYSLVNGCAGTGKTVLAISMINSLVNAINLDESLLNEDDYLDEKIKSLLLIKNYVKENGKLKIGFVFPMQGIRKTIATVFDKCGNGLTKEMVINPYQVKNMDYDILFVDEAHRLSRRKNIVNYHDFDETCKYYGLNKEDSNQLDFIMKASKYKVLFYDVDQSVKGSDIKHFDFLNTLKKYDKCGSCHMLETQMRCIGGSQYTDYIKNIFNCNCKESEIINNYDFKIFDNVDVMINKIRKLDKEYGLCRNVAGYSWKWNSKSKKKYKDNLDAYNNLVSKEIYDIEIKGHKYLWNLTDEDWISRKDSIYTIGCIHTTQGFDLNYVGVIFGHEIDYNPKTNNIEVYKSKFYDANVKNAVSEEEFKKYIINTYITMMARGIKGCYVYACNENLKKYLKQFIEIEE